MTNERSKLAIFSVIIVCIMVSTAFVPFVNASTNDDEDRVASFVNDTEEADVSAPEGFDLSDLASYLGLDPENGLMSLLDQFGLKGLADYIDIQSIQDIINTGDFSVDAIRSILDGAIPEFPTDLKSILALFADGNVVVYEFEEFNLGDVVFKNGIITLVFEDETLEVLKSASVKIGEISVATSEETAGITGFDFSVHIREQSYLFMGHLGFETLFIGEEVYEVNAMIILDSTQTSYSVWVEAFGYGIKISVPDDDQPFITFLIPEYTIQSGDYEGAEVEGMYITVYPTTKLEITIDKATRGEEVVTKGVQDYIDALLKDGFKIDFKVENIGEDITITNGNLHIEYQQNQITDITFSADEIAIGGEPNENAFVVTDLVIGIDSGIDSLEPLFIFQFDKLETKVTIQSQEATMEINKFKVGYYLSPLSSDILSVELQSLKIDYGLKTGLFWGDNDNTEGIPALDVHVRDSDIHGITASAVSAPVDLKFMGMTLENLVPEFHFHGYWLDNMSRAVAWTVVDGECDTYVLVEHVSLSEECTYITVVQNNDNVDAVFTADIITTVDDETFLELGQGIGFGNPLTDFTSVVKTMNPYADGHKITAWKSTDPTNPHSTDVYTTIQVNDDAILVEAYTTHYKNGNVFFRDLGLELEIRDETIIAGVFAYGTSIGALGEEDENHAFIGSIEFYMESNIVTKQTTYSLLVDEATFNGELAVSNLDVQIFGGGEAYVSASADYLNFDLGEEGGLKLSHLKTLMGEGSIDDEGYPIVNLYLDEVAEEKAHAIIGVNTVDFCFHDKLTGVKVDMEFEVENGVIKRNLNIPQFGNETFSVEKITFEDSNSTLKVEELKLGSSLILQRLEAELQADDNTNSLSIDYIKVSQADGTSYVEAVMGLEPGEINNAVNIRISYDDTHDVIVRNLQESLVKLTVSIDPMTITVDGGRFMETTNDEGTSVDAAIGKIAVKLNVEESEIVLFEATEVVFADKEDDTPSMTIKDFSAEIPSEYKGNVVYYDIAGEGIEIGADGAAGSVYTGFKAGELSITQPKDTALTFENLFIGAVTNEQQDKTEYGISFVSAKYVDENDITNYVDIEEVKMFISEDMEFDFDFEKIDVKLEDYLFIPTDSRIDADISLEEENPEMVIRYAIDNITIDGFTDDYDLLSVSDIECNFETDKDGKVLEAEFSIGDLQAAIEIGFLSFEYSAMVGFDTLYYDMDPETGSTEFTIGSIYTTAEITEESNDDVELFDHFITIEGVELTAGEEGIDFQIGSILSGMSIAGGEIYKLEITMEGEDEERYGTMDLTLFEEIQIKVDKIMVNQNSVIGIDTTSIVLEMECNDVTVPEAPENIFALDCDLDIKHVEIASATILIINSAELTIQGAVTVKVQDESYVQIINSDNVRSISTNVRIDCTDVPPNSEEPERLAYFEANLQADVTMSDDQGIRIAAKVKSFDIGVLEKSFHMMGDIEASVSTDLEISVEMKDVFMSYFDLEDEEQAHITADEISVTICPSDDEEEEGWWDVDVTIGTLVLDSEFEDLLVIDFSGTVLKGYVCLEAPYHAIFTSTEHVTYSIERADGTSEAYSVVMNSLFSFAMIETESGEYEFENMSISTSVKDFQFERNGKEAYVEVDDITISGNYTGGEQMSARITVTVDFGYTLPVEEGTEMLTISGFGAYISYNETDGLEYEAVMKGMTYGVAGRVFNMYGLQLDDEGYNIDSVHITDFGKNTYVTLYDCVYVGWFISTGGMAGQVDGTDISKIYFENEDTDPYYDGEMYFSYSEGVKLFKNGEERVIPDDAVRLVVLPSELTFTESGNSFTIPVGDTVVFDTYYDVYDEDREITVTNIEYEMTDTPVYATPAETIEDRIDEKGVVHVEDGNGVVITSESLEEIGERFSTVTIKNGRGITVVISVDGLKRIQSDTPTVVSFDWDNSSEGYIGDDLFEKLNDSDKAKALAGRVSFVFTGESETTDNLGPTKITIPFELGDMDSNKLVAYFLNKETQTFDKVSQATYENGQVTFTTTHFSTFLICEEFDSSPGSKDSNALALGIAVAIIIIAALMVMYAVLVRRPM